VRQHPRAAVTRASTSGGRPSGGPEATATSVPCTCRANTSSVASKQRRILSRLWSTRSGASPTLKLVLRERYGVRLQPSRRVNTACRSSEKSFRFGNCRQATPLRRFSIKTLSRGVSGFKIKNLRAFFCGCPWIVVLQELRHHTARARVRTSTLAAPFLRSVLAHSSTVAPVV